MSIKIVRGDMFKSECQTITNPVNCIGASGSGLALLFQMLYPDYNQEYKRLCREKTIRTGEVNLYIPPEEIAKNKPKWILNFPTKDDWRYPSKIQYIEQGLSDLVSRYKDLGIKSLGIPALGCGRGNLSYSSIEPIMIEHLSKLDIPVEIYTPH